MQAALPYLEGAVSTIERAVPYIYTSAAGVAARQLYRDGIPFVTPGTLDRMPRKSRKQRRTSARRSLRYSSTSTSSLRRRAASNTAHVPPTSVVANRGGYHRNLGRKPGSYQVRRHTFEGFKRDLKDKVFFSTRLINIPWNEDESVINSRRGQLANVRGVTFNCWFKYPFQVTTGAIPPITYQAPVQVRWAIINPKENVGGISCSTSNFFISKNPTSQMAEDFPAVGKCWDYMNRRINKELYSVMSQGMFVLHPPTGSAATSGSFNTNTDGSDGTVAAHQRLDATQFKKISVRIPIRKQMRWDSNVPGAGGANPDQNIYFVFWYCAMGDDAETQRYDTTLTPVRADWEVTNYFTNSRMFS